MKIGIAVFAYNRPEHLQKVIDGLKKNQGIEHVYFFQDGLKCNADRKAWEMTRAVIEHVTWWEKTVVYAEENKGLANSIVDGIHFVFEENDAIIILEDDCVPQPAFVSFMRQCFEKYQQEKCVLSVSGYSWPFVEAHGEKDIYFCGRPCSWGWGTWKDRWALYGKDCDIVKQIKNKKEMSKSLATWGDDLENMMASNVLGMVDSWYVFWALLAIRGNYVCINPKQSLIDNVGFDGSGVHCLADTNFEIKKTDKRDCYSKFSFPDIIQIETKIEEEFASFYGNRIVVSHKSEGKKVIVYGVGNFCKKYLDKLSEQFQITAFVDTYKKDSYYAGIPIIRPKQIDEVEYYYIIIMIENENGCNDVRQKLILEYKIAEDKILMGMDWLFRR